MTQDCELQDCWPKDTGCNQGKEYPEQCPHWQGSVKETPQPGGVDEKQVFPWHGDSFGTTDLLFVTGRRQPTVIGIVGAYNAGKTTFLATTYLLLNKGKKLSGKLFAGSYTLGGWESLAHYLRWTPGQPPQFPPHTSSGHSRIPGLLHASFRYPEDRLLDVLFTDAPGEWFEHWAVNQNDASAEGARWIDCYSSGFILFVDCDALSGSERGLARAQLVRLIHRLGTVAQSRPIAVVWAKSDISIGDEMRLQLEKEFERNFDNHQEFQVYAVPQDVSSENQGKGVLETLDWLLSILENKRCKIPQIPIVTNDPLLAYRGK